MTKIKKWYFVSYIANDGAIIGNAEVCSCDKYFKFKRMQDFLKKEFDLENVVITFFSELYEEEIKLEGEDD